MSQDCGCGRPSASVPAPAENRPGLSALRYRAGTHATFLQSLLEGISTVTIPAGQPPKEGEARPLAGLSVRGTDDPSIALLDAWATMADVLAFYQERIANEGYLRTATERRSLVELARLTGYRPRPGVAASVHLAFDLDDGYRLDLPAGTRAQSVPAPGETMQAFETREPLHARAEWNRLIPRATLPAVLLPAGLPCELWLQGISTGLGTGDVLLLDFTTFQTIHRVTEVHPDAVMDRTRVVLYCPQEENDDQEETPATDYYMEYVGHTRTPTAAPASPSTATATASAGSTPPVAASAPAKLPTGEAALAEAAPAPAAVPTAPVAAALQEAATALERSRVKGSTAEARIVAAEVEAISAAGETVAVADVERAFTVVDSASATVEGRSTTLDTKLAAAKQELSSVLAAYNPADEGSVEGFQNTPGAGSPTGGSTPNPSTGIISEPAPDPSGLSAVLRDSRVYAQPSVPPVNSLQLGRTAATALAAGGIAAPTLLAAFNPALAKNLYPALSGLRVPRGDLNPGAVYVLRVKAAPFGATAPPPTAVFDSQCYGRSTDWQLDECAGHSGGTDQLTLDAVYDRIVPGTWVVICNASTDPATTEFYRAKAVDTVARRSYGLGGRATRLTLDRNWLACPTSDYNNASAVGTTRTIQELRDRTVYAQAEPLALARQPVTADVEGIEIELDRLYEGLTPGRWIIVSGARTDLPGATAAELAMIDGVRHAVSVITLYEERKITIPGDHVHTFITLSTDLAYRYRRGTVQIYGNVAAATHGETREQVLGSGDGSKALQRFELMQGPLTYVPAPTPTGIESTLTVRVDQVRWDEAPHLAAMGPADREYVVRTDHEEKTSVTFGDGVRGARLPTGHENVRAVYRTGIGAAGNVEAGQISLLASRPQGLRAVVNPLESSGGGDPDTAEQIRRNATLGLLSLERIVSVEDYTDFVRGFAGIGKAHASFLTDGRRPVVHVTLAGVNDEPIRENGALLASLVAALRRYGDPHRYLDGGMRDLRALVVSARIRVREDVLWEHVEPKARAAMLAHFGFDRRELGQGVAASEVVAVLQGVWGVEAVDLELLASIGEDELREDPGKLSELAEDAGGTEGWTRALWIPSRLARRDRPRPGERRRILPAQLVVLVPSAPDTLILTEWKR